MFSRVLSTFPNFNFLFLNKDLLHLFQQTPLGWTTTARLGTLAPTVPSAKPPTTVLPKGNASTMAVLWSANACPDTKAMGTTARTSTNALSQPYATKCMGGATALTRQVGDFIEDDDLIGSYYCNCTDFFTGYNCQTYAPKRHCADLYVYNNIKTSGPYL